MERTEFEASILAIFKEAFVTSCHIDDSSVTSEELSTLEELDKQEILENLQELLSKLLNCKQEFKESDRAELANRTGQFETMIQKLEGDVRSHISIEHQLKLHLENTQGKVDEIEKSYKNALETIKMFGCKTNKENSKEDSKENLKRDYEHKLNKLKEDSKRKEQKMQKLVGELTKIKTLYSEQSTEIEKLKAKPKYENRTLRDLGYLKRKLGEKSAELGKMQQQIRERITESSQKVVKNRRSNRKSLADQEVTKLFMTRDSSKKEQVPLKNRPATRAHCRSSSEYSKIAAIRAPSR